MDDDGCFKVDSLECSPDPGVHSQLALIGPEWSRDLDAGLSLVESDHVTCTHSWPQKGQMDKKIKKLPDTDYLDIQFDLLSLNWALTHNKTKGKGQQTIVHAKTESDS